MYTPYVPNERIVDRAVHLWKEALAAPVYRNTRPGERDFGSVLACGMAAMLPKNNTADVLNAFGEELKKRLMAPIERGADRVWYETSLGVDYGPDKVLGEAAEAAGLKMEFPYKTNMHLYTDRLSFSVGYGAPAAFHHPMADGRWVVSTLHGSETDDAALVRFAEAGNTAEFFRIEA